jgi:ferric-dicitrate binding protein FerR (iron transport regulator)
MGAPLMPEIPDRIEGELLGRYLAGECSEGDAAVVRRYLMAHPADARALDRFLERLDGVGSPAPTLDASASWRSLQRRMHGADAESRRGRPSDANRAAGGAADAHREGVVRRGRRFSSQRSRWRRALVLAGCAVAAAWVGVVFERSSHRAPSIAPTRRTYATLSGERAELRLSDGTRVRLAPASRLSLSSDYANDRRDVYLDGEAYFDVIHDARKPFTVFAGNASARDIGTTFAVRNYPEDEAVQVVVRSGEVALSGVGRLGAGDLGRLRADGRTSIRRGVNLTRMLGWLDGSLAFVDAPLGRVLEDMHRWYDVDVHLADSTLATLPFTGTLADVSPAAALELVAATLGLDMHRDGNRVTLAVARGGPPPKSTPP